MMSDGKPNVDLVMILVDQETYDEIRKIAVSQQRDVAEETAIALKSHIDKHNSKNG